jgi:hypothetical protein
MFRQVACLSLFALVAAPASAQPAGGMAAMQYYVGHWNCMAGDVGRPMSPATVTATLDAGILRELILVPAQGASKAYTLVLNIVYDAKQKRYVQVATDTEAVWGVSYAKPWSGNTEVWLDHVTSDNKPGRSTVTRAASSYSFVGYPTATATKPNFKGSCKRAT